MAGYPCVPSIMMWLWTSLSLLSAQSGMFLWLCNLQTAKALPASTASSNYGVNVQFEEEQIMCRIKMSSMTASLTEPASDAFLTVSLTLPSLIFRVSGADLCGSTLCHLCPSEHLSFK